MKKKINYGRQYIDKFDANLVIKSLKENLITTGNYVNLFEKKIRDKFRCKYAYSCCNGTAGLHLAYLAINLKKDDIVLMSSVTFISSYSMAKQLGARIFLVDVDSITGQMTPEKILECIKLNKINKIKAIVTMYLGGYVENNINFYNLKKRLNCYLIEDACHAIGAKYKYKNKEHYIGSCKHSDICVFSFHPVKTITTGEGGAVITNSKFLSEKIKIFRDHGIIRNKKEYWKYNIKQMSFNYKLSDINCSLGIAQLSKLNKFINQRKKIFDEYRNKLNNFKEFVKINNYNNKINAFHLIILNIDFNSLKSTKDEMFRFLNKHNIFPQYHYLPLYKFSFHKKKYFNKFEGTEEYYKKSISLPIYYDLKKNDLAYIIKVVKKFLRFSMEKEKILIIGGTGFIGYHLASKCIKFNWDVTSVSTKKPTKERRLKKVRYKICDISFKRNLTHVAKYKYDYVVNLGGNVDHINKRKTFGAHYLGTKNLFEVFKDKKLKSFIQIGSSAEYGTAKVPHKENVIGNPEGIYGKSKLLASKFMANCYRKYNFPVTILRFYQLFGPKQHTNRFIPILINACLHKKEFAVSSENQTRDFLYIDDGIEAIVKSIKSKNSKGKIFNIGSGRPAKLKNIMKIVEQKLKHFYPIYGQSKLRKGESKIIYPNVSLAKKILKWRNKTTLKIGLNKTINYYKNKK